MKELFPGYYRKTDEEIKEIWKKWVNGYSAAKVATIPLQSTPPIPLQSTPRFRCKGRHLFRRKVRHFTSDLRVVKD